MTGSYGVDGFGLGTRRSVFVVGSDGLLKWKFVGLLRRDLSVGREDRRAGGRGAGLTLAGSPESAECDGRRVARPSRGASDRGRSDRGRE